MQGVLQRVSRNPPPLEARGHCISLKLVGSLQGEYLTQGLTLRAIATKGGDISLRTEWAPSSGIKETEDQAM